MEEFFGYQGQREGSVNVPWFFSEAGWPHRQRRCDMVGSPGCNLLRLRRPERIFRGHPPHPGLGPQPGTFGPPVMDQISDGGAARGQTAGYLSIS